MADLLSSYFPIFVFILFAFGLSCAILVMSFLRGRSNPSSEKLSAYECGFEPFSQSRLKFDVRYYLVALLFIIFDLEIAWLFPWAIRLKHLGSFGFWSMMLFLSILTIGFIYEWRKGALEWE